MIICVTEENNQVVGHFGHTKELKIYDVKKGQIDSSRTLEVNGQGHEHMVNVLLELHCDCLITTNCGDHAVKALADNKILICKGVTGDADAAVNAFLDGDIELTTVDGSHDEDEEEECGRHCGGCCGHCGGCC